MDDIKYKKLINKINTFISLAEEVSPTQPEGLVSRSSGLGLNGIMISEELDIESLSENQCCLIHVMLHNFYSRGGTKKLSKESIRKIHSKIITKIKHEKFDKLDDTNE